MRTILFITALFMSTLLSAQKPVEIPLWPNGAPNTNGLTGDQEDLNGGRVANVVNPTITVYRPAKPNGMTILMCPGGGYARLAMNHEGHDMASWFNTQGITYAVLKYRMPNGNREVPLSDAEQAIRIIRQHAKEWGINPNQVGVMASRLSDIALSGNLYGTGYHPWRFPQEPSWRQPDQGTGRCVFSGTSCISPLSTSFHRTFC